MIFIAYFELFVVKIKSNIHFLTDEYNINTYVYKIYKKKLNSLQHRYYDTNKKETN